MSLSSVKCKLLEHMLLNEKPARATQIAKESGNEFKPVMMHLIGLTRMGYTTSPEKGQYANNPERQNGSRRSRNHQRMRQSNPLANTTGKSIPLLHRPGKTTKHLRPRTARIFRQNNQSRCWLPRVSRLPRRFRELVRQPRRCRASQENGVAERNRNPRRTTANETPRDR